MMKLLFRVLALLVLMPAAPMAFATETEVDVELVLAVDVSRSMTERELEIQRRGYAEALASDQVAKALKGGLTGRIAVTYIEWAGAFSQRTIVDWTLIEGPADLQAFSAKLTAHFNPALRRTSLSGAIDHASSLFVRNGFSGMRKVIDISGDGPNNDGRAVLAARDEALAKGIVINGLPLMTREGMGVQYHLDDLDEYYRHCVIGGPASFVIPVLKWEEFPEAVRRKLVLELAGRSPDEPRLHRAAFSGKTANGYDCLIGEKIWNRMRRYWSEP